MQGGHTGETAGLYYNEKGEAREEGEAVHKRYSRLALEGKAGLKPYQSPLSQANQLPGRQGRSREEQTRNEKQERNVLPKVKRRGKRV